MTRQIDLSQRNSKLYRCGVCFEISQNRTNLAIHHISYFPEKTIMVCRNCHTDIHNANHFKVSETFREIEINWHSKGKCPLRNPGYHFDYQGKWTNEPIKYGYSSDSRSEWEKKLEKYHKLLSLKPPRGEAGKFYRGRRVPQ